MKALTSDGQPWFVQPMLDDGDGQLGHCEPEVVEVLLRVCARLGIAVHMHWLEQPTGPDLDVHVQWGSQADLAWTVEREEHSVGVVGVFEDVDDRGRLRGVFFSAAQSRAITVPLGSITALELEIEDPEPLHGLRRRLATEHSVEKETR